MKMYLIYFHLKMKQDIHHLIAVSQIRALRINIIGPINLKYSANQQVMKLTKLIIMIYYP